MGALSITGLPGIKQDFEPLVSGGIRLPNANHGPARRRGPAGRAWAGRKQGVMVNRPASHLV